MGKNVRDFCENFLGLLAYSDLQFLVPFFERSQLVSADLTPQNGVDDLCSNLAHCHF
jgi:hypothetical protein